MSEYKICSQCLKNACIDFDNSNDDASWEPPHAIFNLAQENDELRKQLNTRASQKIKVVGSDVIKEIVEQAHMAGQNNAGVDPSYSEAQIYYNQLFPQPPKE